MPRVRPSEDEDVTYLHHHTPNKPHYNDVADDNNEKEILLNFEQYTIRESEQEGIPHMKRRDSDEESEGTSNKRSRRKHRSHGREREGSREERRRSKEERRRSRQERRSREAEGAQRDQYDRGDRRPPSSRQPPPQYRVGDGPPQSKGISGRYPPPSDREGVETSSAFIQCDLLAFVIAAAYCFAIAILVLAAWCYRQDSQWNSIIHNERAFPTIAEEDLFGGKYLYLYDTDDGLRLAKVHLLRENRWLELMHLMFMSAFLILTVFQFAAYVTRGGEDHSKLIICYYTVFGGMGLIIALFPLLSWHNQEYGYKVSEHYLKDFSMRVWKSDPTYWKAGLSNATAQDSYTMARIVKFCFDASQDGITFDKDIRFLPLFKRRYRLTHLQQLGFCTHHKFKIVNTIMTTIFAIICCAIPCIYCFRESERYDEGKPWNKRGQREMGPRYQMPREEPTYARPPPTENDMEIGRSRRRSAPEDTQERKLPSHYEGPGGRDLTHRERKEIQKFIRYVEAEDDE